MKIKLNPYEMLANINENKVQKKMIMNKKLNRLTIDSSGFSDE